MTENSFNSNISPASETVYISSVYLSIEKLLLISS